MTAPTLLNLAWSVSVWSGAAMAIVLLMGRCRAVTRRTMCRIALAAVPLVMIATVAAQTAWPSRGYIARPGLPAADERQGDDSAFPPLAFEPTSASPIAATGDAGGYPARPSPASAGERGGIFAATVQPPADRKIEGVTSMVEEAPQAEAAAFRPVNELRSVATDWPMLITLGMGIVTAVLSSRIAVEMLRLIVWMRGLRDANPAWQALTLRLARRLNLKPPVRVAVADDLHQPAAVGLLRRTIIMPKVFNGRITPALRAVVAHELGHLAGRDTVWRFALRLCRALAFWCPFCWWLAYRSDQEDELAADDYALASGATPVGLARTLTHFARMHSIPVKPVAISSMASHLKRRIAMIMDEHRPHNPALARKSLMGLLMMTALISGWLVLTPLVQSAQGQEDQHARQQRVRFVRIAEARVGEGTNLVLVVSPVEGDGQASLLVPRKDDLTEIARHLKTGQIIAVTVVTERGEHWVTRIKPVEGGERDRPEQPRREGERDRPEQPRREGERDRPEQPRRKGERDRPEEAREATAIQRELAELRQMVRRSEERLAAMQKELSQLQAENARLHRLLRERADRPIDERAGRDGVPEDGKNREDGNIDRRDVPEGRRDGGRDTPAIPEEARGFRGLLRGVVVGKFEGGLTVRVQEIVRVWRGNEAESRELVEQSLRLAIRGDSKFIQQARQTLREAQVGDSVLVGVVPTDDRQLRIAEHFEIAR